MAAVAYNLKKFTEVHNQKSAGGCKSNAGRPATCFSNAYYCYKLQ
jgi:hypothetical protein